MSRTMYELMGYKALKFFSLDQIDQWLTFLQLNKQIKEKDGYSVPALENLIADFTKAKQELLNTIV